MDDNFKCIYKILKTLEKAMDYAEFDIDQIGYKRLDISKERWTRYIEMMVDVGYIKGVSITEYSDGDIIVYGDGIRITLKGLEYLTENSIMQRMYKVAKGINEFVPGT